MSDTENTLSVGDPTISKGRLPALLDVSPVFDHNEYD